MLIGTERCIKVLLERIHRAKAVAERQSGVRPLLEQADLLYILCVLTIADCREHAT